MFRESSNKQQNHPKAKKLVQLLRIFFKNPNNLDSKVIVFTNGRKNAVEIKDVLN